MDYLGRSFYIKVLWPGRVYEQEGRQCSMFFFQQVRSFGPDEFEFAGRVAEVVGVDLHLWRCLIRLIDQVRPP